MLMHVCIYSSYVRLYIALSVCVCASNFKLFDSYHVRIKLPLCVRVFS